MKRKSTQQNIIWIITLCFGMFQQGIVRSQDPHFSQFYTNDLYLAPSFAGIIEDTRLTLNYRDQWREISNGYKTYSASIDHNFVNFNSGAGILVLSDVAGSGKLTSFQAGIQYSYDIKVSNLWHIRPGIQMMYLERSINYNNLLWHDQMSPRGNSPTSAESFPIEKVSAIDGTASIVTYTDLFWAGVTVDHLFKPNQSLYNLDEKAKENGYVPMKISVFGGVKVFKRGQLLKPKDSNLQLAGLFKKQGDFEQLDVGFYWYKNPVVMGLWYRGLIDTKPRFAMNNDALILLLAYKIDQLTFGYSYDFTISPLIRSSGGAHEISLAYRFKTKSVKRKPRMVPCPEF